MDFGTTDSLTWDGLYTRLKGAGASMDNLSVLYTIPEPTTSTLAVIAFVCLSVFVRHRRKN